MKDVRARLFGPILEGNVLEYLDNPRPFQGWFHNADMFTVYSLQCNHDGIWAILECKYSPGANNYCFTIPERSQQTHLEYIRQEYIEYIDHSPF